MGLIRMEEVRKHNTKSDCWVVLCGDVWDVTEFLNAHPGGGKIIFELAGTDGSKPFTGIHPKDMARKLLSKDKLIGQVDQSTVMESDLGTNAPVKVETEDTGAPVTIEQMLNCYDFEQKARQTISRQAYGYYAAGGGDEITIRENSIAFDRIWAKPRVMVDVSSIDLRTTIFGYESALPLYVSATAMCKLAHPDGECAIVKACANEGVAYMLPTLASCSLDEMLDARSSDQIVWSQLYVNPNREKTKEYVEKVQAAGAKALFITVDAPGLGRRERDMRNKFSQQQAHVQSDQNVKRDAGVSQALSSFIDVSLNWNDLAWFFEFTKIPIILKGVQCVEDAVLALKYGCSGVVLSNHGGRQADTSRSAIEILPEVMDALRKEPGYSKEFFSVFIDGGIRRGSDIFKAIALGATAVGIGRPSLYSLGAFGQPGVEKMLSNFKSQLYNTMQNCGTQNIYSITPDHVVATNLTDHITTVPRRTLFDKVYSPLVLPGSKL
mmetsp:Transcript_5859/g.9092  ORF Transcript_5859/g.9092 Transcript_5859/m.9092 type:complete len:494 (-) Transcript_5859:1162-2643(-)|eukprot:CAMPEP_0203774654 /NCGR_PEP_ID=MMETSP0099_2-20121227/5497_1 /ASSEMBLY_ACC=CAM_ASM_000209 /TAXON_ID=96639 /ORGANISM=" , Strain NY0313808BC1" /LENGTH=493 /DNA_ID=CAMNT_0050672947 /DNA_START=179 /DNA_END=1660 /DNA_ORIENTATION=+